MMINSPQPTNDWATPDERSKSGEDGVHDILRDKTLATICWMLK